MDLQSIPSGFSPIHPDSSRFIHQRISRAFACGYASQCPVDIVDGDGESTRQMHACAEHVLCIRHMASDPSQVLSWPEPTTAILRWILDPDSFSGTHEDRAYLSKYRRHDKKRGTGGQYQFPLYRPVKYHEASRRDTVSNKTHSSHR